jgi:hypothetical protein
VALFIHKNMNHPKLKIWDILCMKYLTHGLNYKKNLFWACEPKFLQLFKTLFSHIKVINFKCDFNFLNPTLKTPIL